MHFGLKKSIAKDSLKLTLFLSHEVGHKKTIAVHLVIQKQKHIGKAAHFSTLLNARKKLISTKKDKSK